MSAEEVIIAFIVAVELTEKGKITPKECIRGMMKVLAQYQPMEASNGSD